MSADYTALPPNLPVPEDDGAADHLPGLTIPALALPSTLGGTADLAELARGRLVAYVYPRTGTPGEAPIDRLGRHPRRPGLHSAELRLPRRPGGVLRSRGRR